LCTIPLGCGEPSRARKWKSQADGTSSDAEIDPAEALR
jgi:hypothetical protein